MTVRLPLVAALAAILAYEAYAVFVKRSGESSYRPTRAETFLSAEIAGEVGLEQTFVMHADGLETIRLHPARAPREQPREQPGEQPRERQRHVQLTLRRDNWVQPFAVASFPADRLVPGRVFEWAVPRVDASAGRSFTVMVAIPDAAPGHGLRFELGPPRYLEGELRVGGRGEWGDLAFSTVAARARVADTLASLRRRTPWLRSGLRSGLTSELFYAAAWAAFNAALVVLVVQAGAATRAPR